MQILDAARTAQALPYDKLVPAVARAAHELANGKIRAPERQLVPIDASSVLLCMPAIADDIGVTKLITVHAGNAVHGLPAIQGEVIVFDTATGRRIALLDGPTVTARRTAAVTLLGIDVLAARKPQSALLIGAGVQAAAHAEALIAYFGISAFWLAARDASRAQAFGESLKRRYPHIHFQSIAADSLATEVPETDLVLALTTSKVPVIPASLAPQTLAIGVGAFKPDMAEFPPELLRSRRVVVDDLAGARHEAGDLLQAGIDWSAVKPLSAVLDGSCRGLEPMPVLKTVGQASWDLAAGRVAAASLESR
ncbi:delta(1)-pyrroline-2-carboxylate reductase family protein [Noviherbaspirillum agri]